MRTAKLWIAGAMVLALWACWTLLVYRQGYGHGPFGPNEISDSIDAVSIAAKAAGPDFSRTGSFGDSYGGFSALISALAFLGVIFSLQQTRDGEDRQSFDSNFYSLLGHFQQITASMDIQISKRAAPRTQIDFGETEVIATGRDALRFMLDLFYEQIGESSNFNNSKIIYQVYQRFYDAWSDDLGHYFRLLYNIFRLIDESCPGNKTFYSRIVRAHLSESELSLLAYNCIVGEGREKFIRFVEKYSLLHNIADPRDDFSLQERAFFERWLAKNAFRYTPIKPFEYERDIGCR